MDSKGQGALAGIAIAALVFILVLMIFGAILGFFTEANNNNTYNPMTGTNTLFGGSVVSLVNLLPLVLVGGLLVVVIVAGFKAFG